MQFVERQHRYLIQNVFPLHSMNLYWHFTRKFRHIVFYFTHICKITIVYSGVRCNRIWIMSKIYPIKKTIFLSSYKHKHYRTKLKHSSVIEFIVQTQQCVRPIAKRFWKIDFSTLFSERLLGIQISILNNICSVENIQLFSILNLNVFL